MTAGQRAEAGAKAGARPVEVELKYRAATIEEAEAVLAADELAGLHALDDVRTTDVHDRYVDTADRALARAGFAARLRTTSDGTIVSLKSTGRVDGARAGAGGPHRREELDGPAGEDIPPRDWPASVARSLVLELAGDAPLAEVATLRQVRRRRALGDASATVELSLDEVEVLAAGRTAARWVELEAELVHGDESRLDDVAAAIEGRPGLTPARRSKLEAALDAVQDVSVARSAASRTPGVAADDSAAEAGRKVLGYHFRLLLARQPGASSAMADGVDAGATIDVHKMRVATRRMRAAWRIFGDAFRPGPSRRLQRELRRIARRLGAVRDLDVLLEGLEAHRSALGAGERAALEPLAVSWRAARDEAHERLVVELGARRYRRWVTEMQRFVATGGLGARDVDPAEPHHVRDTAPSRIWAALGQVRAYEPLLPGAELETLHELRIAARWLRYGLEFVREPLGPDAEAVIPRVVELQDHLGRLHDADVAAARVRDFLAAGGRQLIPEEAAAIGRYLGSLEAEVTRLRDGVGAPWRAVAGSGFRRRLGRAVANL
jgi:CHAD domain-containing protein